MEIQRTSLPGRWVAWSRWESLGLRTKTDWVWILALTLPRNKFIMPRFANPQNWGKKKNNLIPQGFDCAESRGEIKVFFFKGWNNADGLTEKKKYVFS